MQSAFFGTGISKKYESQFDTEASEALDALKRYFGRDNVIAKVRNGYAFHYSPEEIDAGYRTLAEDDPLEIYLSESNANTLYTFGDTIAGRAMLEAIRPGDHKKAFEMLVDETTKAVARLNIVISATMMTCFNAYMGGDFYSLGPNIIEIKGATDSERFSIPYFFEIAEHKD
jgi:hypothetical protein